MLKMGEIDIARQELRARVKTFLNSLILMNPKIPHFLFIQKKVASWLHRNALSDILQFQITGDEKGNTYINIYEDHARKNPRRESTNKKTKLRIERPWNEYNKKLTELYAIGEMPRVTFQRGYAWIKNGAMLHVQKKFLQYCQKNTPEIVRISRIDASAYRRGIANHMLSFINTKFANGILMKNAFFDPDHFAHNMAWRSLEAKIESDQLTINHSRQVTYRALRLLLHPSTICRNKALLLIDLGLRKKYIHKAEIRPFKKILASCAESPNPIIFSTARKLNRALGNPHSPRLLRDRERSSGRPDQ